MSEAQDYNIVGSFNSQRVTSIDAERSVNMFEYRDVLGKKPKSLINTSGLDNTNFSFPGATGGSRGHFVFNNDQYVVFGSSVFLITTIGSVSLLGSLTSDTGYVGITANTFQVIFVDGQDGFIWDTSATTYTKISDPAFPASPIDVCYLDGFFWVADGGTNSFQGSSYNQGLVWGPAANNFTTGYVTNNNLTIGSSTIGGDSGTAYYRTGVPVTLSTSGALPSPLQIDTIYYCITVYSSPGVIDPSNIQLATTYANAIAGTAITLSDDGSGTQTITSEGELQQGFITSDTGTIVACRTLHRRIFLFSQNFTEVWENAGIGTNLPIRRNNSLLMEYGCAAIGSIAVGFDKMFFLSQDRDGLGAVMEVIGAQSIPVSTRAIDFIFAQYAATNQISDCRAFLIKENGLIFYRMNFTEANHTWIYNVTLSDPTTEENRLWHEEEVLNGDRHPAQTHAYLNGINYVADYDRPIMYIVNSDTFTNNGEAIRRMRIARPIVPQGYQRIRIDRLQLDLLQGSVQLLQAETTTTNLLTELGDEITTESGDPILVSDQIMTVQTPLQPFVYLSISKDGGQSYGYRIPAPMGKIGQRQYRTLWRKLGVIPRGQAFVPKIEFFAESPFVILGGAWAYEILPE